MYNTPADSGARRIDTALDDDLAPFCAHLRSQRIVYRVYERQGRQVLEVPSDPQWQRAHADYQAWRDGRLALARPAERGRSIPKELAGAVARYPGLVAVTLITLALYPLTWPPLGAATWLRVFTIVDFVRADGAAPLTALGDVLTSGEVWRLLTPVFLHFSPAHLAFNLAVVLGFGRRIEHAGGSLHLLATVALIGVGSNLVQYLWSANALFGGLSGVAYGFVAYVVMRARASPNDPLWRVHPSLIVSLVVVLVLMTTGFTELFGLYIANAAHWAGLAFGALIGAAAARWAKA